MKKNDTLNEKFLKPRKETIDFLLSYSRSIAVLKSRGRNLVVSKN